MTNQMCDCSGDFSGEPNNGEEPEAFRCNRIFLNFTRECRHPVRDKFNMVKVKDLFKYLSERQDLQEMKVSGWSEERESKDEMKGEEEDQQEEEGEGEEEYLEDGLESCYEDRSTPRRGGQRFAMSRDFWYRKLNTLKAQKLDEVALEARDLPPDDRRKEPKEINWARSKVFSSEIPEKGAEVLGDIDAFEKSVAKPVEKELRKRFVNVYDNKKHFTGGCG